MMKTILLTLFIFPACIFLSGCTGATTSGTNRDAALHDLTNHLMGRPATEFPGETPEPLPNRSAQDPALKPEPGPFGSFEDRIRRF